MYLVIGSSNARVSLAFFGLLYPGTENAALPKEILCNFIISDWIITTIMSCRIGGRISDLVVVKTMVMEGVSECHKPNCAPSLIRAPNTATENSLNKASPFS